MYVCIFCRNIQYEYSVRIFSTNIHTEYSAEIFHTKSLFLYYLFMTEDVQVTREVEVCSNRKKEQVDEKNASSSALCCYI